MNMQPDTTNSSSSGFLSYVRALLGVFFAAFIGKKMVYFPLIDKKTTISPTEAMARIDQALALNFENVDEAKHLLDEVKASYNEVKAATEYQDQKTARLLTILAFLTAATGAVFSKVVDIYPLHFDGRVNFQDVFIATVYILFGCYLLLVVIGALISFYAMQTRFVFKEDTDIAGKSKSLLFFKYIAITTPEDWAKEFNRTSPELLAVYITQYIKETYLIAAKTSDKVRYIQPAQDILQLSIKVLILWIIALIVTAGTVPRVLQQNAHAKAPINETVSQAAGANPVIKSPPPHTEAAPSQEKKTTVTMPLALPGPADIVAPGNQAAKHGSTEHNEILPGGK